MEQLRILADAVILIGGVFGAINMIAKMLGKPLVFFKKRKEQEIQAESERIKKILEQTLPDMFKAHDIETRDRYRGDRENYLHEIRDATLQDLQSPLDEVLRIQKELKESLDKINRSTLDILRQRIMGIYEQYKHDGKIPLTVKENLDELYKDYTGQGGNSYITKYYRRMCLWEVIDDIQIED